MELKAEKRWLPVTRKEIEDLGWDQPDVIIITGDAYIDHPSFGAAVIGRVIESGGFRVAVIPQPNWRDDLRDFRKLGKPKYFFGVTAGNMDSMVNHYTAARRLRSNDAYTPGGKAGFRPDYATIIYTRILKELYPDIPVIAGGIEASMRRLTHYDYWSDRLEPSIILSSGADMLVYGMGEQPIRGIMTLLAKGVPFSSIRNNPQTVILSGKSEPLPPAPGWKDKTLHSHEECLADKLLYAENFKVFEKESNKISPARIIEPSGDKVVIVNPPSPPMSGQEVDKIWELPFRYSPHPRYRGKGEIPAYEMIRFSVNIHRGCFGGCSFCAIAAHQGKQVISRSEGSVFREIAKISALPGFKGYLTDLGGPSANMYGMKGKDQERCLKCSAPSCIWPAVCDNLDTDHSRLVKLYRDVNTLPGIKKAFIGSGIRYDLLFREGNPRAGRAEKDYLRELVINHLSGWLKVAPEHTSPLVLKLMRKMPFELFGKLRETFELLKRSEDLNCVIIPYFISGHPGCSITDMRDLGLKARALGIKPEQVQDFTPTPMTLSTAMYYLGMDPYTGKKLFVAKETQAKKEQKEMFFWYKEQGRQKGSRPGRGITKSSRDQRTKKSRR